MSPLREIIEAPFDKTWGDTTRAKLEDFAKERYGTRWGKKLQVRVNGDTSEEAAAYAAFIPADQPKAGPYGGMSFVLFPSKSAPALVALVVGTNGLEPDEQTLGRPGHARKAAAIARWLNSEAKSWVAWAKRDPVRMDQPLPKLIKQRLGAYAAAVEKYERFSYLLFIPESSPPNEAPQLTDQAALALVDLLAEERDLKPLQASRDEKQSLRDAWLARALPSTTEADVASLIQQRRFVVLEGPPGTGKTRMAQALLRSRYDGHGRTIQFHPSTTYETFIGGLAPAMGGGDLGLQFAPRQGHLMEAAAEAMKAPDRPYLLHIDEINRADLAKVLGEAIYLLEPGETGRSLQLPYDFGKPFGRTLALPPNLHLLGTMNSADRSIAILDVAVRRRFAFVPLWPDPQVVEREASPRMQAAFRRLFSLFLEEANDDAFALMPGHAYFLDGGADANTLLRTGLKPLLMEYLAQGYVAGFADAVRAYLDWLDTPADDT